MYGLDADDTALVPIALVAVAVHVYVVPFVTVATTIGLVAPTPEPVVPPFEEVHVTSNWVMVEPPLLPGGETDTLSAWLPLQVTEGIVGAPGTFGAVNDADAEAGPVPTSFVAVTEQRYAFPRVRPVTSNGLDAPKPEPAVPPFVEAHAASYRLIAEPPSAGAENAIETCWLPGLTLVRTGGPGTAAGTKVAEAADAGPVPTSFVAVAVHV